VSIRTSAAVQKPRALVYRLPDEAIDPFDETFRTALTFLANPFKLWEIGNLDARRMVLRLVLNSQLPYNRIEGFRTAD